MKSRRRGRPPKDEAAPLAIERVEAAVQKMVEQLAAARARVAELEAKLGRLKALFGQTAVVNKISSSAPVLDASQASGVELAGGDNLGEGRWA